MNHNFYFEFSNGIRADFNQIADGFKSILIIVAEIMLQKASYLDEKKLNEDTSGIVIIDELEAHLHMSMQEKILPSLEKLFPNMQFIVSTHSPQVCASSKNAYLYDLTTKSIETDYIGGVSYAVISKSHFGLPSNYSIATRKLLSEIEELLLKPESNNKKSELLEQLITELIELSPELSYEVQLYLRKQKLNTHD